MLNSSFKPGSLVLSVALPWPNDTQEFVCKCRFWPPASTCEVRSAEDSGWFEELRVGEVLR